MHIADDNWDWRYIEKSNHDFLDQESTDMKQYVILLGKNALTSNVWLLKNLNIFRSKYESNFSALTKITLV